MTFCQSCFYQGVKNHETHCSKCGARFLSPEEIAAVEAEEAKTDLDRVQEKAQDALSSAGVKVSTARDSINKTGEEAIQSIASTRVGRSLKDYWVGWALIGAVLLLGVVTLRTVVSASRNRAVIAASNVQQLQTPPASDYAPAPIAPAVPVVQAVETVCPECKGQGSFAPISCAMCSGTGRFTDRFGETHACSLCGGIGFQNKGGTCQVCAGSGHINQQALAQWQALQQTRAHTTEIVQNQLRESNRLHTFRCRKCFAVKMMTEAQKWSDQNHGSSLCPNAIDAFRSHFWEEVTSP